jgi:hypothetical protein
MRYFVLLLASLLTLGCGDPAGNGNHDPHSIVATYSPPSITELTPDSVPVNSVPFAVTVNGANFGADAVVFWNGNPVSTRFVTPMQLMAVLTPTDLDFAGLIPVYVRTAGLNSNTVDFNVTIQ